MKKSLFIIVAMFFSITASAQFVTYKPITTNKSRSGTQQRSNNLDFNTNQRYQTQQNPQPPQPQVTTIRGFYIKNSQWHPIPMKVKVDGDDTYVIGLRGTTGWSDRYSRVSSTQFMQQEIKDCFDYYIHDPIYGNIYF